MSRKIWISLAVLAAVVLLGLGVFYFQQKKGTFSQQKISKIIGNYYHNQQYRIDKVSPISVNGQTIYRVKVSFPKDRLLGVCGRMIKVKNETLYVKKGRILDSIPKNEIRTDLKKYGAVERIEKGNFKITSIGQQCQLSDVYKAVVKLGRKKNGKNVKWEIYLNPRGDVLYSRIMTYGKNILGRDSWNYGPGMFGGIK